jgi:hypothetical protein
VFSSPRTGRRESRSTARSHSKASQNPLFGARLQ